MTSEPAASLKRAMPEGRSAAPAARGRGGGRSCAAWRAASRAAWSPAASRARPPGTPTAAARPTRPAAANEAAVTGRLPAVPFHGKHQAGILPEPQPATAVVSFNVTAEDRGELTELFQTVTDRARFLTAGGTPPPVGIGGPPSDSGVLGPTVVPDGLTVTFGVGVDAVRRPVRAGRRKPARLTADDVVPQRRPRPGAVRRRPDPAAAARATRTRCCTRCGTSPRTPAAACRSNWRIDGFASPRGPPGRCRATCWGSWTASPTRR